MDKNSSTELIVSADGINFYIISSDATVPHPFGIAATMDTDPTDSAVIENMFFTHEEAEKCCLWLADNSVFPVTLCDVLSNLYCI